MWSRMSGVSQEQSGNESVCSKRNFYLISYVPTTGFGDICLPSNVHVCTIIILVVKSKIMRMRSTLSLKYIYLR